MGDYALADTVYVAFTTHAFATGIPTVLAGTPVVSAYEDASLTQITAGITLGVDHDSVAGLNMLTIVATGANGYETDKTYNLVITTGTVDSVSVVGKVVGRFTLDKIPKATWDRVLTGATHNIATSAGRRLRQIEAGFVVDNGTAQAGAAGTITLASTASTTNDIYAGDRIIIVDGTGAGEHGIIVSYVGSTRVATMSQNWVITPDNTSVYEVAPADVDVETWQHVVVTNGNGAPDVNVASTDDIDLSATQKTSVNAEADTAISDAALATAGDLATVDTVVDAIKVVTDNLAASATVLITGAAEAGTLSTTQMTTDLSEATDDHFIGRAVIWTGGVLLGQASDITGYLGATGKLTYSAVTEAPSVGDPFVIV